MSSTLRLVLSGCVVLMGYGVTIIASSHISWDAGYAQALTDLRFSQQCNDLRP